MCSLVGWVCLRYDPMCLQMRSLPEQMPCSSLGLIHMVVLIVFRSTPFVHHLLEKPRFSLRPADYGATGSILYAPPGLTDNLGPPGFKREDV